jgi:hypothetical protein
MTLVSLPGTIPFPGLFLSPYAVPAVGTAATLTSAGHYYSVVTSAREDMVVTHIGFRAGTATGSPECTVGIETVDTSGNPAGSAGFGSTNSASTAITAGWTLIALGGTATIPKGSLFAIKIAFVSGTSQVIQHLTNVGAPSGTSLPYYVINTGAATKSVISHLPQLALGSSSTTFYYVPGIWGVDSYSTGTFANTNSPKRGLKFTPNFNCRAVGLRYYGATATGDYNIGLYTGDASGTELSSSSTAIEGAATPNSHSSHSVYFDSPVTLTAGTAYRVAIEPTSATNCNVSVLAFPSSDYYSSSPAVSSAVATYSSLVSGTWTDSTTQIPFMDVLIDQIDDGAGTGGGGGGQRVISG